MIFEREERALNKVFFTSTFEGIPCMDFLEIPASKEKYEGKILSKSFLWVLIKWDGSCDIKPKRKKYKNFRFCAIPVAFGIKVGLHFVLPLSG